jgi:hypothetical protein
LAHLEVFSDRVDEAVLYVESLASSLPVDNNQTIYELNEECGADVSFLPGTLNDLKMQLNSLQGSMHSIVDIASCHQISPLVRRITHGAICSESFYGLVWIWACSLVICVLSFVLLTTRAALYNSIIAKKPREQKPKRVVEKEFNDYKDFMATYYEDSNEWKMQPPGKHKVEFDFGSQIGMNPTFETQATSKDECDNFSEGADINHPVEDEISYGSSYDSECSDDSEHTDSDDDSQSAFTSFFVETKSIAMQTIHTMRTIRPLLATFGRSSPKNEEGSMDDDSLFMDTPDRQSRPSSKDEDGLRRKHKMVTPPSRNLPLFGGSSVLSVLTPMAPQKAFAFLARTNAAEIDDGELDPLTPTKPSSLSSDMVPPRQLKLSPYLSPGATLPASPYKPRRRRFSSDEASDDMSVYLDDNPPKKPKNPPPERPQKVYRRYGRTQASREGGK